MSLKSLTFIIYIVAVIVLILSLTSAYSPIFIEEDIDLPIKQDIDSHNEPVIVQDIDDFVCKGTSFDCCPPLTHRIASENHARGASIILINKSGYNMTLNIVSLEDGRWVTSDDYPGTDINCEPQVGPLLNGTSEVFSSVTSHFLGGILGYTTFTMDDDMLTTFTISWSVPTVGSPEYSIKGLSINKYQATHKRQLDDTIFHVTVEQHIPFSFPSWTFLIIIPLLFLILSIIIYSNMEDSSKARLNRGVENYGGTGNGNITFNNSNRRNDRNDRNYRVSPAHMHHGNTNDRNDRNYRVPPAHMYYGDTNPGFPPEHWNGNQNQKGS